VKLKYQDEWTKIEVDDLLKNHSIQSAVLDGKALKLTLIEFVS